MKPTIAETPEFRSWLKTQKENPDYDYKATRYYKEKKANKSKDKFLKASVTLLIIIYFLLFIIIIL